MSEQGTDIGRGHRCSPPNLVDEGTFWLCPCGRRYAFQMDYWADHVACYWFEVDGDGGNIPPLPERGFAEKVARWMGRTDR